MGGPPPLTDNETSTFATFDLLLDSALDRKSLSEVAAVIEDDEYKTLAAKQDLVSAHARIADVRTRMSAHSDGAILEAVLVTIARDVLQMDRDRALVAAITKVHIRSLEDRIAELEARLTETA